MTNRGKILCFGLWGGLLVPLAELPAQRLEPPFPNVAVEFIAAHQYAVEAPPPDRGRCGRSSSPVVRGLVGAAAGAAAGYLLFTLNEKVLSWGGESTGDELRRERTQFILGMAAFGAAFEVVGGPHLCRLSRAGA